MHSSDDGIVFEGPHGSANRSTYRSTDRSANAGAYAGANASSYSSTDCGQSDISKLLF